MILHTACSLYTFQIQVLCVFQLHWDCVSANYIIALVLKLYTLCLNISNSLVFANPGWKGQGQLWTMEQSIVQSQVLSSSTHKQQVYDQTSDQPGEQDQNDHHDMICIVSLVSMVCMTHLIWKLTWWKVIRWQLTLLKVDMMKNLSSCQLQILVVFIEGAALLCWSLTPTSVFIAVTFND